MSKRPLVYYVTAHGYGHAARTCDILAELGRRYPLLPVRLVSDLDPAFFRSRLGPRPPRQRQVILDSGMNQFDSVRLDMEASLAAALDILSRRDELVRSEVRYLQKKGAGLVVADVPGIPLEAARIAGIPSVAVGNFGWDWIYEGYTAADPRWRPVAEAFAAAYRRTDLLLHLPFAEPMSAFPHRREVAVLASPGRPRRDELARRTGADSGRRWSLLVFSDLEWSDDALDRVARLDDHEFFTVRPLAFSRRNIHAVSREDFPFADVLASCDLAITKPGYGIVSECVANRIPMVYVDRGDFREYHVLVEAIERHLRFAHLPSGDLYAGDLEMALAAIEDAPPPLEQAALGGAAIAADTLHELRG